MRMIPDSDAISYVTVQSAMELSKEGHPIVDVRIPEAFAEEHVVDSGNICVYEMAFTDKFKASFPEKDHRVILYGESGQFHAAEVAFGRLKQLGYSNLSVMAGGLEAWTEAGLTSKSGPSEMLSRFPEGRLKMSHESSVLRWTGRNLTNQHHGRIEMKSGWIGIGNEGVFEGGQVIVDMEKISCSDISDTGMNQILISHLSNIDFFLVEEFPEARFTLLETRLIPGNTPGQPNYSVTGEMTVRGVTKQLGFNAMINFIPDGVSFQAQVDLNRVLFGAVYGSGSLFERLGMHLVNDLVTLDLTLIFRVS